MGLMLQVILQLMNLCFIVAAIGFPGSSAFGEPLSLESSSPFPSIKAQVPTSVVEQGPFLNGSILQPPIVSPSANTPPVHQLIEGPPPLLSPKESTILSPQPLHVSAPQLPAEPPKSSEFLVAKSPQRSNSPIAELPYDAPPPFPPSEPPIYTSPLHQLIEGPPPFLSPKQSTTLAPQLPAEPPKSAVFSAAKAPQHSDSPIAESPHDDAPPLPASQPPPNHSFPPFSAEPPNMSRMTPTAETPRASGVPSAAKAPVTIPQLPTVEPPEALPLASSPSPPEVPQPISAIPSSPIPSSGPPPFSIPANVSSHASPQPSVAKPPLSSALPLAAKPPESKPQFPSIGPTATPPKPSGILSPPLPQNVSYSPPQSSPYALSPPPQLVSPNAPPPMSIVNPHASVSPVPDPSTTLPSPTPLPPNIASPPPSLLPPIVFSPPPELVPPILSFPPPQLAPPIVSVPPHLIPPIVPSPPPQIIPPIESAPPPQLTPPIVSSPPPQLIPPIESAPPPQRTLPSVSSPPPVLTPPIISSPPPQLIPPSESAPPELTPPIVSAPPPELTPPIVSAPPPELTPPIVSSPPPQLIPPMESAPPQMTPPIVSPPQLITPPASPTPAVPSNVSVPPPLFLPPTHLPLSPPAAPSHASPPIPSHAASPLPQLTKPHPPSPPHGLSAPPPVELPHISPPHLPIAPGIVPPYPSPPSPFLTPPLAPASPVIPSHPLSAPPPSEPLHSSVPPSPAMQRTVPAAPPRSSQRKETQKGAPPPLPTSPESSPSSKTLPEVPPPAHQVIPRSHPPSSHETEAPKQSPPLRSNATEPATLPSSAPSPSEIHVGRYPSIAPPGRAPDPSPRDKPSPYPAAAEPTFERHDPTAPTPLSFSIPPTNNGSRHSLHHSPVKGPPTPTAPLPSPGILGNSPAPSSLPRAPSNHSRIPVPSPKISPSGSSTRNTKRPLATPIRSLPPPPPNADCAYMTCDEPLTNTPPGSPCGCVWPMQVGMRLGVALYTFFPLVSELAREVAAGVFMNPNQVRVMGANATTEELDKTIVIVNLIPLDVKFDNTLALLIFQRFWHKQVVIDKSLFGDYDILYVRYPGLPPSPPMAPADMAIINGMPYSVGDPNKVHPLGVDVTKQRHKHRLNGIIIAAVVFSAIVALLIFCFVAWLLIFRHTNNEPQVAEIPRALPSLGRSSGPTGNSTGSGPSSSLSIGSSLPPYTGSAKTFSASEIEKATDNLNPSRVLGEGGFGLVYSGVLEDTTHVAVKVLKRDDQQGGREFLAEVEMLSRLHHRNLVKLIGICTDERLRCLVYELIPNGSVDSHLHGKDRETAPLDWASRMKIALGAARGLAYLHEDSSPRVIHRDFKSSNILLENDFTPKVSDFGLARAAMDEENRHISTRVMGTFGYVAPEYAMTGHLLVKSDVYSYGVVLLEILTGRKPVDMLQPPGQENLVAWTRPFLSTQEGLELILDPSLGTDLPLDSVAKVAAIASMCVQPEVSHRPFMGEVVQALKLVCNESDDSKGSSSRHGNLSADFDVKGSPISDTQDHLPNEFSVKNYLSGLDVEKGMSVSEIFGASVTTDRQASDSFRRHSASGPLKTERGRHFWQRIRRLSNGGSVSEHGIMYRLWTGSQ